MARKAKTAAPGSTDPPPAEAPRAAERGQEMAGPPGRGCGSGRGPDPRGEEDGTRPGGGGWARKGGREGNPLTVGQQAAILS